MKVLVTGATGFIGQYVVQALLDLDWDLEVIASGRDREKASEYSWFSEVKFIPYDLESLRDDAYLYFQQPDLVIHLAWDNLGDYKNPIHLEKHLPNHYQFLKTLLDAGLKKLVVAGTCFEYGLVEACVSETVETKPVTVYAKAKDELHQGLLELENTMGSFQLSWLRLFYTYGPGQRETAILPQLQKAIDRGDKVFNMSPGDQVQDYLPAELMAERIVKCALQSSISGVINCCSGQPTRLLDLVKQVVSKNKSSIELNLGYYDYSDYEPKSFWGDTARLKQALSAFEKIKALR